MTGPRSWTTLPCSETRSLHAGSVPLRRHRSKNLPTPARHLRSLTLRRGAIRREERTTESALDRTPVLPLPTSCPHTPPLFLVISTEYCSYILFYDAYETMHAMPVGTCTISYVTYICSVSLIDLGSAPRVGPMAESSHSHFKLILTVEICLSHGGTDSLLHREGEMAMYTAVCTFVLGRAGYVGLHCTLSTVLLKHTLRSSGAHRLMHGVEPITDHVLCSRIRSGRVFKLTYLRPSF